MTQPGISRVLGMQCRQLLWYNRFMAAKALTAPETTSAPAHSWRYLEARPHSWRRSLSVKGRRLRAFSVWSDMIANGLTAEEIAQSRDLPVEAVRECIQYSEENRHLLTDEADQEKHWLLARGVTIEPPPAD